ncbi:MAG: class I SAM-dependent methyltransferase [Candidatus Shapirobacteria bacterium]|nr:class I SAM-dependent methyltransferase [Candidatus Shapirobacteria bacterium]
MNEINQEKPRLLDVGAGFGELFIDRAKAEPNKNFIVFEPLGFPDQELPENLTWIKGRLTDQESLPFQDGSIDGVILNFSLSTIYADYSGSDQEFGEYLQKILTGVLRVLKDGGEMVIREERGFCLNILEPGLNGLGVDFVITPAKEQDLSLTGQEMLADYYFDPEKNHDSLPLQVVISKTGFAGSANPQKSQ